MCGHTGGCSSTIALETTKLYQGTFERGETYWDKTAAIIINVFTHTALTLLQMLWTHHWGENGAVGRNHLALIQTHSERNLQAPNAYRLNAYNPFFLSFFSFNWDANQVLWSSQTVTLKKLNNLEQSTFYFLICLTFLLFPPCEINKAAGRLLCNMWRCYAEQVQRLRCRWWLRTQMCVIYI